MLFTKGYVPFHHLAGRARRYLKWRLQLRHDADAQVDAQSPLELSDMALENLHGISQRIALGTVWNNGGHVHILTSSGGMVLMDVTTIEPDLDLLFNKHADQPWHMNLSDYLGCSLKAFQGNSWLQPIIEDPLFRRKTERRLRRGSVFNWAQGMIDVSSLLQNDELQRAVGAAETNVGNKGEKIAVGHRSLPTGRLAMLLPYHGCPVLVPIGLRSQLEKGVDQPPPDFNADDRSPAQRIIAFKNLNPQATKKIVQLKVFPEASRRQFESNWRQACELDPNLGKAGRRPKSNQ